MKRPRSVVLVGNFDGVHIGHAALVRRAREVADAAGGSARVVALVFDPHPMTVLRPSEAPARLTTFEQRSEALGRLGVDEVVRLEPTGNLLAESPGEFVARVAADLAPIAMVEGPDFRFGRGRAGDVETLRELGTRNGFGVEVVVPVEAVLTDHTVAPASSTLVRWLVAHGRVGDATAVLGRPYAAAGTVQPGDRRGREIGYPTANIATECLAPGDGVYSGVATVADGRKFVAAISVGTKPTFGGSARTVEAFFLDAPRLGAAIDGLPEYGWAISLAIHHWIRDQLRFGSVPDLLEQMGRDCARVRELHPLTEVPACR